MKNAEKKNCPSFACLPKINVASPEEVKHNLFPMLLRSMNSGEINGTVA